MSNHPIIIVDTSLMVAFYNKKDNYHAQVTDFFSNCTSKLVTTSACVTEVMYFLRSNWLVQNVFLSHLANKELGVKS